MKIKLGQMPLIYPIPIVLGGALVDGKANFAELGDSGIMGLKPALVYISLATTHHTTKGVLEHKTFSINIPNTQLLSKADYCGMATGKNTDKSRLFDVFYGELKTAPMIDECPVNLECRVVHDFIIEHRHIFVGSVEECHISEEYCTFKDGKPGIADMTKLDPIIYGLDNNYYSIGSIVGKGYNEGKKHY